MGIGTETTDDASLSAMAARWDSIRRLAVHPHSRRAVLALVDQAVVSGSRFLTTVLVGRAVGDAGLGVYALGFTVIVIISCVQDSLITVPYTVFAGRYSEPRRRRFAGSMLVHHGLLSAFAFVGLVAVGLTLAVVSSSPALGQVLTVVGLAMPFLLLREFARRMAFAHLRLVEVLQLDLMMAVVQLGALFGLYWYGGLSPATAHLVVGVGAALASLTWLYRTRHHFAVIGKRVRLAFLKNWKFARWVFAGELIGITHSYITYWLLAWLLNQSATGIFSACMTVVMLSNPFLIGISNLLMPTAAQAYARSGTARVAQIVFGVGALLLLVMGTFSVGLSVFGDPVIQAIYGAEYGGHQQAITILALGTLSWAVAAACGQGLRVIGRPDVNLKAASVGLVVTIVLVASLTGPFQIWGAALGMVIGNVTASVTQLIAFVLLSRAAVGRAE